jgi:very-short-patch-repair endonuclease
MSRSRLSILRSGCNAEHVKNLRSRMTDAEWRLWYHLRANRFLGLKFRRQVPMGPYTVDFLCERARLIVEVDGGQHADRIEGDTVRTAWLEAQGYSVIRFWNNDVLGNTNGVLEAIATALGYPLPDPLPRERETLMNPLPDSLPRERETLMNPLPEPLKVS